MARSWLLAGLPLCCLLLVALLLVAGGKAAAVVGGRRAVRPPSFVRPATATTAVLLKCRGGEASLSKAPAEQHNASAAADAGVKTTEAVATADADADAAAAAAEEKEEGEETFHDAVAAEPAEPQEEAAAAAKEGEEVPAAAGVAVADDEEAEEAAAAAAVSEGLAAAAKAASGPEAVRRRRAESAGEGKKGAAKDKYNAKMQWVITGRMRKVLVEELHYLPEEVDVMMPDVAAVVINKHLERPRKGMPPEWRKDFHLRSRGIKKLKASVRSALNRVREDPSSIVRGAVTCGIAAASALLLKKWRDARMAEEEDEYEWVEVSMWEELVEKLQATLPLPRKTGGSS